MPVTVLVAFDGSPLSARALAYAIETFPDASITSMYVINPLDSVIDVEAGGLPVAEDWHEQSWNTPTTTTSIRSSWAATVARESTVRSSGALPRRLPAERGFR